MSNDTATNPASKESTRLTKNTALTAEIESLNYDASGVAHVQGKTVFVDGALPGETAKIRLLRRRKRHDTAIAEEILSPSPLRVTPRCCFYKRCGGCSLQHLSPDAQITEKQKTLEGQFKHIGRVEPAHWLAPLTGPVWHYRRKARLGVRYVTKKGGTLVGFRERHSSYITDMNACEILDTRVAHCLPALRPLIDALSCREHIPQIEVAAGDTHVALVFRHLEAFTEADKEKLTAFGQTHDVHIFLQPGNLDSIAPLWPEKAAPLSYRLQSDHIEIFFGPADFIQINAGVNQKTIQQALTLLDIKPEDNVCDLFCGLGNFTLPIARHAARVLGLEGSMQLVAGAQHNAKHNGIDNAEFAVADLYKETDTTPWGDFKFNKMLLDPPRSGAAEVLKHLGTSPSQPERIVYISCYPATLARDAGHLVHQLGYRLESAGVMDMFPHTSHVESMALFVKDTERDNAH